MVAFSVSSCQSLSLLPADDEEWQPYSPLMPFKKVRCMDGKVVDAVNLMRIKINGEWQYRRMTEDEYLYYLW